MARFKTTIEFDGKEVGYAIGRNKKESKLNASKHILMAMCPQLYEDWQRSRKVNNQNIELTTDPMEAPRPQSPSLDNMMNLEDENPEVSGMNDGTQGQSDSLSLEKVS